MVRPGARAYPVEIGSEAPNTRNMAHAPSSVRSRRLPTGLQFGLPIGLPFGLFTALAWLGSTPAAAQTNQGPLSFLEIPDPTPLPGPDLVPRLLFESPLPLTLILVVGALVLYVVFNARARFKTGLVLAGACLLLAGGLWIMAALVKTEHEKMRDTARQLVDAVVAVDLVAMDEILAPDVRLSAVPTLPDLDKSAIIEAVGANLGPNRTFEVEEHSIQEIQTALDGPSSGRVQLRMRVQSRSMGFPNISWWALGLSQGSDGVWRVVSIRAMAIRGVT